MLAGEYDALTAWNNLRSSFRMTGNLYRTLIRLLIRPGGLLLLLFLAVPAQLVAVTGEGAPPPDPARVDEAVRRGVEYILRMQFLDGSWTAKKADNPGHTALNALALVKSGIPGDHPAIRKALNHISLCRVFRTYDTAVVIMLLEAVDPVKHRAWIGRCAAQLIDTQRSGLWAYPASTLDLSNTQYAALGLRSAAAAGVRVHRKIWEDLLDKTVARQGDYGGWGYRIGSKPTGSMTCAGLTCILICREQLEKAGRGTTASTRSDRAFQKGLEWFDRHFSADRNPQPHSDAKHDRWKFYYLYGVERLGALAGRKTFAGKDWYNEVAAWLLKHQHGNGDWGTAYGEYLMNTPFALLFLIRATLSSYTAHQPQTRIQGGNAKDDIVIACNRKNPGIVWIESWSRKVADKFGRDGGKSSICVQKVEYFADGESIGVVTEDPTGGRITRYPFEYRFDSNGDRTLSARVTCTSLGGTIVESFDSAKLKMLVHDVPTETDLHNMDEARDNLLRGAFPQVDVSSAWAGNAWTGSGAVDGLQGTSWLSREIEEDGAPWIKITFTDPPRANTLKVTHAIKDWFHRKQYGRATRVRVLINRGSQRIIADLGADDGVKYAIPFKTTRVREITIEMLERERSKNHTAAGFAEIELFLEKGRK
jgi:hypothetical protein